MNKDRKNAGQSEEGLQREGMLEAHMQVNDSYREGTLDVEVKKNEIDAEDEDFPYPSPT